MSETPLVSVIIPVYNAEKYLRECLDSVINQTLTEIEIICVDDGSTDSSLNILREYEAKDRRFRVLTQKNQFAGVARNNGMAIAKGTFFAFLDADDYYTPDALGVLYSLAEQHSLDIIKASFFNLETGEKPYDTQYSTNTRTNSNIYYRILSFPENLKDLIFVADVAWNGLYRASFIKHNNIVFNDFC